MTTQSGSGTKWWFNGQPFSAALQKSNTTAGSQKYWIDGQPMSPYGVAGVSISNLGPGLVSDSDAFHAPGIANILQFLQPAAIDDADTFLQPTGTAIGLLLPGIVSPDDALFNPTVIKGAATLAPALLTDADTIAATTVYNIPVLQPALFASDDAFFAAVVSAGARTLTPSRVTDSDTFLSLFVTLVGLPGGPLQKLKPPPKLQDTETIFAFTSSRMSALVIDQDVIRAPAITAFSDLRPGFLTDNDTIVTGTDIGYSNRLRAELVTDNDVTYGALITMILQPELKLDGDGILASDVGWQVIADFTEDADQFYSADAYAFYPLYPDVWFDEETIDTYPFYVQQITGGVPVAPREGVLTGSIKRPPQLTGSITKARRVA